MKPWRKYNIDELIDACSNSLSESRGRYSRISERTIRDDIRVMRSDILGFNAPIVQTGGLYFYSDPKYTILSVGINDPGILQEVIRSLLRIRSEIRHPELETILEKLRAFSPEYFEHGYTAESSITSYDNPSGSIARSVNASRRLSMGEPSPGSGQLQKRLMSFSRQQGSKILWEEVIKAFCNSKM